jgi:V8-like Glu-specific endopeptidase
MKEEGAMKSFGRIISVALWLPFASPHAAAAAQADLAQNACVAEAQLETAPALPAGTIAAADPALLAPLRDRSVPVDTVIRVEGAEALAAPLPADGRKVRVGTVRQIGKTVELSGVRAKDLARKPRSVAGGAIRGDGRDGFIWSGVVESPGASALRLRFTGFFLPQNVELFLYSDQGDVVGPYTQRGPLKDGEFWSHTLRGSRVTLDLSYEGSDTERVLRATRFVIADVGRLDESYLSALGGPDAAPAASDLCPFNADCIKSAANADIPPAIQPAQRAAARIQFVSGVWLYICSGGLIADTDPNSTRPLFLTANHCVSRDREARSLEAYFQFIKDEGGSCSLSPDVPRTLGSRILATGKSGDFTLLELNQQPPADSVLLGWTATAVAFSHGTPLFRISHPGGAPQAYSEHVVDTSRPTCSGWPRGERIYSSDTFGGTQGGSSGSPVLIDSGQIVGQLSGACGYNVGDPCDSENNATVDGALAHYFSVVEPFLNPPSSCTDADSDGSCAGEDCNDANPAVNPSAAEICDDGIDNDCDGAVDGADADCQTGGCDLLPVGAPCDSDGQCCSGKCRGKQGSQLCR